MSNIDSLIGALEKGDYADAVLDGCLRLSGDAQMRLFALAQKRRIQYFPDNRCQVRSVIEISNICRQKCRYCAIGGKDQTTNYTLNSKQIVMLVDYLYNKGRRVILLQSGENVSAKFIGEVVDAVRDIKSHHEDIRLILCLGDLAHEQYQALFDAGASDYILKFEASDEKLFAYCKPNDTLANRLRCIEDLCDIGFRVGSGNIVGLPTQTFGNIIDDLKLIHRLPLGMNSSTVFIPSENSAFGGEPMGNPDTTLNMMTLMRIMNPQRLMPTTSSLEKAVADGQYLGLLAGANTVTIHDGTPDNLQQYFPIYSQKRVRPQTEHFKDILIRANMNVENII